MITLEDYERRIISLLDAHLECARSARASHMERAKEEIALRKQAEAERDVLAGYLAELLATCPSECAFTAECPFPDDCRVPPEKVARCWIAYARQQTQKRAYNHADQDGGGKTMPARRKQKGKRKCLS
ncbi:MAG: hypothetical protein LBC79_07835 [Deltaproteobacteria bacterium]|jgi:hypothetical protein|nr:hypothetical protein [Deltaproteobacteria bacterium]